MISLFAIKLLALSALWWLFFSPAHRPPADPATLAERWLTPAGTPVNGEPAHD